MCYRFLGSVQGIERWGLLIFVSVFLSRIYNLILTEMHGVAGQMYSARDSDNVGSHLRPVHYPNPGLAVEHMIPPCTNLHEQHLRIQKVLVLWCNNSLD